MHVVDQPVGGNDEHEVLRNPGQGAVGQGAFRDPDRAVLRDRQLSGDDREIDIVQVVRVRDLRQPYIGARNAGYHRGDAPAVAVRGELLQGRCQSLGRRKLHAAAPRILQRLGEARAQIDDALPEPSHPRQLARRGRSRAEPGKDVLTASHAASTARGSCRAASRAARARGPRR